MRLDDVVLACSLLMASGYLAGAAPGALQEDVSSAQKSFIGILVGVAVDNGLLEISKPVT